MWKNITRLICMVCAITLTFSCFHSEKSKYLSMCSRTINISTEHMLKILSSEADAAIKIITL